MWKTFSVIHFFGFCICFFFLTITLGHLYSHLMADDLRYNKTQVFYQRATLVKEVCEKYNLTKGYVSRNTLEQHLLLSLDRKVRLSGK